MERKVVYIFSLALLLRLFLVLGTNSLSILSTRLELATPFTCLTHVKEGIFLLRNNVPIYEIPSMPAPLVLLIMSILPESFYGFFFIGLDLVIGWGFYLLVHSVNKYNLKNNSTCTHSKMISPSLILACYLFNPLTWMSSLAGNVNLFSNIGIIFGLHFAITNRTSLSVGCIILASYVSIYPILLLIPIYMMTTPLGKRWHAASFISFGILSLFWMALFLSASYIMTGSWAFFSYFKNILFITDLTPNIGLCWYLFMEMFQYFHNLFLIIIHSTVLFLSIPLCVKFRDDPFFLAFTYIGMISIFKSYPTLSDLSLTLTLLLFFSYLFPYMNKFFVSISLFLYALLIAPINHYWWMYQGNGNSNYYFAMTLVISSSQILSLLDCIRAKLYYDFYLINPYLKMNQKLSIMQQ